MGGTRVGARIRILVMPNDIVFLIEPHNSRPIYRLQVAQIRIFHHENESLQDVGQTSQTNFLNVEHFVNDDGKVVKKRFSSYH